MPPENIFAQKINSTALRVGFRLIPPDDRNGIITKYLVNIRQLNVDTNFTTYEVIENGAMKILEIGGLEKWRDYEYTVAGCTIVCGVESPIVVIRTDQDCKYTFSLNNAELSFLVFWKLSNLRYSVFDSNK